MDTLSFIVRASLSLNSPLLKRLSTQTAARMGFLLLELVFIDVDFELRFGSFLHFKRFTGKHLNPGELLKLFKYVAHILICTISPACFISRC